MAGSATGDYLLAHRIPRPAQALLRILPAGIAGRLLLAAITRHAWTFTGSGRFTAEAGSPTVVAIANCPICRGTHSEMPACDYYAATFERLFTVLVHPDAKVVETDCMGRGASACRFEIRWR
jgi:divinyl protochlorophyllide a 8-vinyl-reductase